MDQLEYLKSFWFSLTWEQIIIASLIAIVLFLVWALKRCIKNWDYELRMLNNSTSGEIGYLQTNLMNTQANILRSELLRRNPDLFLKTLDQARKKVVSREFKEGHFRNKRSV